MSSGSSSRISPSPLSAWRRRTLAATAGIGSLVALAAWWALRPLPVTQVPAADIVSEVAPATEMPAEVAPVDRAVFEAVLWAQPRSAATATDAATAEKPCEFSQSLELDLIGVTEDAGVLVAALYDRRADRLLLVKHGEEVQGARVSELSRDRVTLKRGDATLALARRRNAR